MKHLEMAISGSLWVEFSVAAVSTLLDFWALATSSIQDTSGAVGRSSHCKLAIAGFLCSRDWFSWKPKAPGAGKCPNFSHHPNIGDVISNGYFFKWCETNQPWVTFTKPWWLSRKSRPWWPVLLFSIASGRVNWDIWRAGLHFLSQWDSSLG